MFRCFTSKVFGDHEAAAFQAWWLLASQAGTLFFVVAEDCAAEASQPAGCLCGPWAHSFSFFSVPTHSLNIQ
jgi:hypothetical protein